MDDTAQRKLLVCTSCRTRQRSCPVGLPILARLADGLAAARRAGVIDDFALSGIAELSACGRPCTAVFAARGRTAYLFGDVAPDSDVDSLIDIAALYAERGADAGSRARPSARLPGALFVTELDPPQSAP